MALFSAVSGVVTVSLAARCIVCRFSFSIKSFALEASALCTKPARILRFFVLLPRIYNKPHPPVSI